MACCTAMHNANRLDDHDRLAVKVVPLLRPLHWLRAGWADLLRCLVPGLLHGAALAVFGLALFWTLRQHFWSLVGAFTGFLLVAPVLATGLYALSRALERGEPATLGAAKLALCEPSLFTPQPRITASMRSPSRSASPSRFNTTAPTPSPNTVPVALASKARQWPSWEWIPPAWGS